MATRRSRSTVLRVSPTRLKTYLYCPRQYYYAYVRRLPRRARGYFSFGTSLHAALQDFHVQGGSATQPVDQLMAQLETSWVSAGYQSPEEQVAHFDLGQQILSEYYRTDEERRQEVGPPSETLFLERTLSIPRSGFVLTGRVDRLDRRPDGVLEVLDYKSGGYMPSPEDLAGDVAIGIYQVLVSGTYHEAPVVGTIYNLRQNEAVSITRDQTALDEVAESVDESVRVLNDDTQYEPAPGPKCRYCDFAGFCPAAPCADT